MSRKLHVKLHQNVYSLERFSSLGLSFRSRRTSF